LLLPYFTAKKDFRKRARNNLPVQSDVNEVSAERRKGARACRVCSGRSERVRAFGHDAANDCVTNDIDLYSCWCVTSDGAAGGGGKAGQDAAKTGASTIIPCLRRLHARPPTPPVMIATAPSEIYPHQYCIAGRHRSPRATWAVSNKLSDAE